MYKLNLGIYIYLILYKYIYIHIFNDIKNCIDIVQFFEYSNLYLVYQFILILPRCADLLLPGFGNMLACTLPARSQLMCYAVDMRFHIVLSMLGGFKSS